MTIGRSTKSDESSKQESGSKNQANRVKSASSFFLLERRMTRSLSRKMNYVNFVSIPSNDRLQSRNCCAKRRGNKKFVVEKSALQTLEPKNILVLIDVPNASGDYSSTDNNMDTTESNQGAQEIAPIDNQNLAEDTVIDDVLNMMEEYGVEDNVEEQRTCEEIIDDLMQSGEEYRLTAKRNLSDTDFEKQE